MKLSRRRSRLLCSSVPSSRCFQTRWPVPKGLRYVPEFVSRETERELISRIAQLPLQPFSVRRLRGKPAGQVIRVPLRLHGAEECWRRSRSRSGCNAIRAIGRRLWATLPAGSVPPDALHGLRTLASVIGWHRDKPHFDKVFGLSLGGACKFPLFAISRRREVAAAMRSMQRARSIYMMGR